MGSRIAGVVVGILCAACAAGAQEISDVQLFPGVARLAGEPPSQWVSDVTVNNPTDEEVEIGFIFLLERTAHEREDFFVPEEHRYLLAERETRQFADVLNTVFGITENVKGALLVTSNQLIISGIQTEEVIPILATMRTYDVSSPVGTYGQTIPANSFVENTSGEPSIITGVRNDDRFRSNLGIINSSLEEVTIHYRIIDEQAVVLAQGSKVLPSVYIRQWRTRDLLGIDSVEGPMTIDLWFDPNDVRDPCVGTFEGGNSFYAYVSKVDSATQDAEYIWAAPAFVWPIECD